jgi:hypothetical protein
MIFNEALDSNTNQKLTTVRKAIENNPKLNDYVFSVRPEVDFNKNKNEYQMLIVLRDDLFTDMNNSPNTMEAEGIIKETVAKYGGKVKRNGFVVKVIFKPQLNKEEV